MESNMKFLTLRTGDRVREHDGRHVGRVEAIYGGSLNGRWHDSATATVKWEDNGFFSHLEVGELVRVLDN
jgi:hypothetical protein